MIVKTTPRPPLFKPDTEAILTRGVNALTMACDSLNSQNEELLEEIKGLNLQISRLQEKILENPADKE
jgi:hypothetical protein